MAPEALSLLEKRTKALFKSLLLIASLAETLDFLERFLGLGLPYCSDALNIKHP